MSRQRNFRSKPIASAASDEDEPQLGAPRAQVPLDALRHSVIVSRCQSGTHTHRRTLMNLKAMKAEDFAVQAASGKSEKDRKKVQEQRRADSAKRDVVKKAGVAPARAHAVAATHWSSSCSAHNCQLAMPCPAGIPTALRN